MLPGFRFLCAAIALSTSILVFGLGAAALLRAAHEEFASIPSWHAAPETMLFAQPSEATRPALAMLRIEPPAVEQSAPDNAPSAAEPAAIISEQAEPDTIAALKPQNPSSPETAKPEIPVAESPSQGEAAAAQADALAPADGTKIAANEPILSPPNETRPNEAAQTAPEQMSAPVSPDAASTKIATLGDPPVATATPPLAKVVNATPDKSAIKKRTQAQQAIQRRKIALRARVARQAPQQPADPFAQPVATARKR